MSSIPFHPGRRSFSFGNSLAGFLSQPGLPFAQVLAEDRIDQIFEKHDDLFGRVYTTAVVLWAFMSQVLRDGKEASCQSAVSRISSHLQILNGRGVDSDTRDYCRARAKLSEEALHNLSTHIATDCESQVDSKHLFKGRHAKLIDGSTFLMPDTIRNQRAYPQNPVQIPGVGFPIARFVVVISLATACVIDAAIGQYKGKETGEGSLMRQLFHCFSPGDVAVADRLYGNYWMIAMFMKRRVDVCFRKHHMRPTDFRRGKRLGKNDHLITWHRPLRSSWMSVEVYESLPMSITLREIRYTLNQPGRKQQPFVIVTTLFQNEGKQEISVEDIAELFGFRWNAELDIRSIKTNLNLNHLRCKSPEMVHREFWTTIVAYNAIRMTAACSAELADAKPREISFVSTCQYVLAAWDVITSGALQGTSMKQYCEAQLAEIAKCNVGHRPGRFEPRVRKKRGSNYKLMKQSRAELRRRLAKGDNSFETR